MPNSFLYLGYIPLGYILDIEIDKPSSWLVWDIWLGKKLKQINKKEINEYSCYVYKISLENEFTKLVYQISLPN